VELRPEFTTSSQARVAPVRPNVWAVECLMLRVMMVSCVALLTLANVGCVVLAPGDGGGEGEGEGEGGEGEGEPNPELCSASNPCPSGQFCWNGFCALGCTSDDNCDADTYCNVNHCAPTEVPTCSDDAECDDGFACVFDYCAVIPVEPEGCQWNDNLQDGCAGNEVCLGDDPENDVDGECTQLPPCPEDGDCPVGEAGAVCNEGYIPTKDRICLVGLCATQADCPSSLRCVVIAGDVGSCNPPGVQGSPCTVDADCSNGLTCDEFAPGFPSLCGGGGIGEGEGEGEGEGGGEAGSFCDVDADCAAGLTCADAGGGFGICE
jgi:hypothetical protein